MDGMTKNHVWAVAERARSAALDAAVDMLREEPRDVLEAILEEATIEGIVEDAARSLLGE